MNWAPLKNTVRAGAAFSTTEYPEFRESSLEQLYLRLPVLLERSYKAWKPVWFLF